MDSVDYQENEEDYDYENDEDSFAGLGASISERPAFSEDSLKYAKSMSNSPYRSDVLNYVKKLPITERYKQTLYHCIFTFFTEDRVFAYNDPRKIGHFSTDDPLSRKLIFAQRNIEFTRCEATKPDMEAVNVGAMEKYILSVFEDYISRTVGPKKERYINSELSTRSVAQSEIVKNNPIVVHQKKKGGFLGFGGK